MTPYVDVASGILESGVCRCQAAKNVDLAVLTMQLAHRELEIGCELNDQIVG